MTQEQINILKSLADGELQDGWKDAVRVALALAERCRWRKLGEEKPGTVSDILFRRNERTLIAVYDTGYWYAANCTFLKAEPSDEWCFIPEGAAKVKIGETIYAVVKPDGEIIRTFPLSDKDEADAYLTHIPSVGARVVAVRLEIVEEKR